ncbi:MAG: orotidine-5'-phosphate decarboxylase [Pseudomonadota bacterium]
MKMPSDYITFPLDVATAQEACRLTADLAGVVGMFKIGLELFVRSGPAVVQQVRSAGARRIFLDLKLHDIPKTVERAAAAAAAIGVDYLTVHCGEDKRLLEAAVAGAAGRLGVLGVTVLTSTGAADLKGAGFGPPYDTDIFALVCHRAGMAIAAGCAGIVCSGMEVARLKAVWGNGFTAVTPGIRPAWEGVGADDQRRVVTPAEAVRCGADYLVIGRPIRNAPDPVAAARRVAREIAEAL